MESNELFSKLMNFSATGKEEVDSEMKKLKPSERMLLNIKKSGINMEQMEPVLKTKGNQLVISSAGSGKTTTLIYKIIYDITTGEATRLVEVNNNVVRVPEKIWVCTFLKSGAEELKAKMALRQRELGVVDTTNYIQFSTLHAEFKRALNSMGVATEFISASENTSLLKKVLGVYNVRNSYNKPLNSEELRDFESALVYTRNRLDGKRYAKDIYDETGLTARVVEAILHDWKEERLKKGLLDFEDLQEMLYTQCVLKKDEKVIDFIRDRFNFIYVDEFQDTSQIQYEVLKVYISGARKVVAIGDDDQTIYSWRGSYNGIITHDFDADFHPTINKLSYNFRCPSKILNAIIPSIERNENRYGKEIKAARKGGVLRVRSCPNYKNMVNQLGDMVYKDVSEGKSVAILCRVNSDGLMPALLLDKIGKFQYNISGEGMTLDSYIGRLVLGIIRLFTDNYSSSVEKSLSLLSWDKYNIQKLLKVCKNNKVSIWDLSLQDIAYTCPDIYGIISEWRTYREKEGDVFALKMVLEYYRTRVFKKDNQFNRVCKTVISSMTTLLDYNDYESVVDFLDDVESINERLKARRKMSYGTYVRIATVHEFKGKEADSVYVWNDCRNVFPYAGSSDDQEMLDEERRIHYIACTRAKKISTIMYLNGEEGEFVSEMDLSEAENFVETEIRGVLQKSDDELSFEKVAKLIVEDDKENVSEVPNVDGDVFSSAKDVDKEMLNYILESSKEGKEPNEIFDDICELVGMGVYDGYIPLDLIEDIVNNKTARCY